MNLRSLFQRLRLPKIGGKKASEERSFRTVKSYSLEFANIEDSPSYELSELLSVGAETGDIVISDPSLAPRHAVFELNDGVVTVQALGGESSIGDHRLTVGKAVILKADDEIMLGELQVIFRVTEQQQEVPSEELAEEAAEPAELPHSAPLAEAAADEVKEAAEEEPSEEKIEDPQAKIKQRLEEMRSQKKKTSGNKIIGGGSTRAANILPRAMGGLFDVFWTIALWQILSPFDDFRLLLEHGPQFLQHEVLPVLETQIAQQGFQAQYQSYLNMFLDLVKQAEDELALSHQASLFFSWRLLGVMLMGVSAGSWMAGVRAYGNVLWKRIGGLLREILGWVLLPLLIGHLPTLFSKRSLHELLSFTHLYSPSKGSIVISWVIFTPLLVVIMLLSPLVRGLELPIQTALEENVSRSKKNRKPVEASEAPQVMAVHSSRWFNAQFTLAEQMWRLYPRFSWTQSQSGSSLIPSLVFSHQDGTTVPLSLAQSFDWPQLLMPVFAHNPPMQQAFPVLWNYVQMDKLKVNKSIQPSLNDAQRTSIQVELQELIKVVFALAPENLVEHVLSYGPLIKGLVVFRSQLFGLMGATEEGSWTLSRYGKTAILLYQEPGIKPSDYIIPLVHGPGRVFRINYAANTDRNKASKLLNNELWGQSSWTLGEEAQVEGAPLVIDVIAQVSQTGKAEDAELERVYGYFYETAAKIVEGEELEAARAAQIRSMKNLEEIITRLEKNKATQPWTVAGLEKLRQKIAEVAGRLEVKDIPFFRPDAPPAAGTQVSP